QQTPTQRQTLKQQCRRTAKRFSMKNSVKKITSMYSSLFVHGFTRIKNHEDSAWARTGRLIQAQWELVKNLTKATGALLSPSEMKESEGVSTPSVTSIF